MTPRHADYDRLPDPSTKRELAAVAGRSLVFAARYHHRFSEVECFCLFVGYGRSGHSLVGSLLDAHSEIVIAHELDALRYVQRGFRRSQLYGLLLQRERAFTSVGRSWTGYDYSVPGQSQGTFRRLRVIGDKRGWMTTLRLGQRPELLDRLRRLVGVPLRVIHVTRNPYDNIATMAQRSDMSLDAAIAQYTALSDTVAEVHGRLRPEEIIDVCYEHFVAEAPASLAALCRFLGVEATESYVTGCSSIIRPPRQSRDDLQWSAHQRTDVDRIIAAHPWFAPYRA